MAKLKITEWDASEYLKTDNDIVEYLSLAFEDNDINHIKLAIATAAKAKNMTELAKKMGISRTSLYKSLSTKGNPEFNTIHKILNALGVRLSVVEYKPEKLKYQKV
ncbi:MAG: putative addiction module antidote protein [Leptospirales bacterium]|nr:putative addiction module antidote protein [Leptospirales bacterium]